MTGGVREGGIGTLDLGVRGDFAQGGERTEVQALFGDGDAVEAIDVADVDELGRRDDAFLHEIEQIDAACLDHGTLGELPESFIDGVAIDERELVHACISSGSLPSAVSTLAGVMGSRRMRTPVAL